MTTYRGLGKKANHISYALSTCYIGHSSPRSVSHITRLLRSSKKRHPIDDRTFAIEDILEENARIEAGVPVHKLYKPGPKAPRYEKTTWPDYLTQPQLMPEIPVYLIKYLREIAPSYFKDKKYSKK